LENKNVENASMVIAVIGLGYTGLPLALALSAHSKVIGYDSNDLRVRSLQKGIDHNRENDLSAINASKLVFTTQVHTLKAAEVFIVAVPTPINDKREPDLQPLSDAMHLVGALLKKGDCVVLESTVYPGCTEEYCVPILEKISGLKLLHDFTVGYSPERINPGDTTHQLNNVVKLVAASDPLTAELLCKIYQKITRAGVHLCASIPIAEAAKLTENIQRDVNIALMNELSTVYQQMGIEPAAVWEAASTKWNFLPFRPGLAGGHCISVDPYYLLDSATKKGISVPLVNLSREVNENMVTVVGNQILSMLADKKVTGETTSILMMGISFKADVSDIRNAKPIQLAQFCVRAGVQVDLYDPIAVTNTIEETNALRVVNHPQKKYDLVVIAVAHRAFKELEEDYFCSISQSTATVVDLTGYFRSIIKRRKYWSI
jgi:UDP-N-acetyl-D-galactosamine dehydrogenase